MASGRVRTTDYASINATARRLGCRPSLLRAAVQRGELETYALGGRWLRLHWPAVERWIRAHCVVPTDHARQRLDEVLRHEALR